MREMPMYSPNPKGQLYSRFTHKESISLAQGLAIVEELNSYFNYDTFKWVFEETPRDGTYQPLSGLFISEGSAVIKTNSQIEFKKGDIVLLKWSACPKGQLYIITEADPAEYIYTPKPRQAFQRIELRKMF